MAEKYLEWSPYVYCADNPIKYIDPDGRMITDNDNSDVKEDNIKSKRDAVILHEKENYYNYIKETLLNLREKEYIKPEISRINVKDMNLGKIIIPLIDSKSKVSYLALSQKVKYVQENNVKNYIVEKIIEEVGLFTTNERDIKDIITALKHCIGVNAKYENKHVAYNGKIMNIQVPIITEAEITKWIKVSKIDKDAQKTINNYIIDKARGEISNLIMRKGTEGTLRTLAASAINANIPVKLFADPIPAGGPTIKDVRKQQINYARSQAVNMIKEYISDKGGYLYLRF